MKYGKDITFEGFLKKTRIKMTRQGTGDKPLS